MWEKGAMNFLYCLCQPYIISALFCVVFSLLKKSLQFLCQCGLQLKFSNDKWIKITVPHLRCFAVVLVGRSGLPKNHTRRAGN